MIALTVNPVAYLPLVQQNLGMGGGLVAITSPDVPGIEWRSGDHRLHYTALDNRPHWTASEQRLHYTALDNRPHWTASEQRLHFTSEEH